jgi:hypothetical protein
MNEPPKSSNWPSRLAGAPLSGKSDLALRLRERVLRAVLGPLERVHWGILQAASMIETERMRRSEEMGNEQQ